MCSYQIEARIETERLILRPPRISDAERIAELIADYDIVKMLARAPWPYTVQDARAFVSRVGDLDPAFDRPLTIEHREHGVIGSTGFHTTAESLFPEVGYWIARDHWGQGYATEATTAALGWARDVWGKRAVASGHFADNAASARVLDKAGFLYTGDVVARESLARGALAATRMMIWLA